jgi:hypothetical protein
MTTSSSPDRATFRATLAQLAERTQAKIPALNGRVEKACKLVLAGDVTLQTDGSAAVNSLSNPTLTYRVAAGVCACRDFAHAPEGLCAHRLAVGFVRKVAELLPTPAPVAQEPLYEAPASVNVHLEVSGRMVQLTLRDRDEWALLARLEEVLQRFPQAQAETPAQPTTQRTDHEKNWCAIHNVQMALNRKEGRFWYSHPRQDGQGWCKGR